MSTPVIIPMPATAIASATADHANVMPNVEVLKTGPFTIAVSRVPGTASNINAAYTPTMTQTMDFGMGFTITFTADLKEVLSPKPPVVSPPTPTVKRDAPIPSPASTPVNGRRNTLPSGFRLDLSGLLAPKAIKSKEHSNFVLDCLDETDGSETLLTPVSEPSSPIFPARARTASDVQLPDVIRASDVPACLAVGTVVGTEAAHIEEGPAGTAAGQAPGSVPLPSSPEDADTSAVAVLDHHALKHGSCLPLADLQASQSDLQQEAESIAVSVVLPDELECEPQPAAAEGTSRTETNTEVEPTAADANCAPAAEEGLVLDSDARSSSTASNVKNGGKRDIAELDEFACFTHTTAVKYDSKPAFVRKESLRDSIVRKRAEKALKSRESGDAEADVLWYASGLRRNLNGCDRGQASQASKIVTSPNTRPTCIPTSIQHAAAEVLPDATPRLARRLRRVTPSTEFRSHFIPLSEPTKATATVPKKKQAATFKGMMKGLAQRVTKA